MKHPLHNWPGFARVSAGNTMPELASSELRAISGTSVQVAEGLILCSGASSTSRMAGPFGSPPLPNLAVSPLGVVPKKEPNKFSLIHHLSYPRGGSVNDSIDPDLCTVSYISFGTAVSWVRWYGQGALLEKTDIEAAFRLLPVHPDCCHLLGCHWQGQLIVDRCFPMVCAISCSLFEKFSSLLEWAVVSGSNDPACFGFFGVPLAADKTEGPVTELCFLGIVIDSMAMECRLPLDKLADLKGTVSAAMQSKKKFSFRSYNLSWAS